MPKLVSDPLIDALSGIDVFGVVGPDDKSIRAAFVPAKGKTLRGSVIVSPGRTEYIEKYAETIAALIARKFNVLIIDQRGQGLSDRLTNDPMAGHMDSFQNAARHLHMAVEAAGDRLTGPLVLLCHSMGGCIGLEALLADKPLPVKAALFSAPMWGLKTPAGARLLARTLTQLGKGSEIAPTTPKVWKPEPFDGNALTHDSKRFTRNNALNLAEPGLQIAGPTNGWLDQAFKTMAGLTPDRLAKLTVPALVVSGEADVVVDNSAHIRIAGQWPGATYRIIQGAKHELLVERDDLRDQFWAHADSWLADNGI